MSSPDKSKIERPKEQIPQTDVIKDMISKIFGIHLDKNKHHALLEEIDKITAILVGNKLSDKNDKIYISNLREFGWNFLKLFTRKSYTPAIFSGLYNIEYISNLSDDSLSIQNVDTILQKINPEIISAINSIDWNENYNISARRLLQIIIGLLSIFDSDGTFTEKIEDQIIEKVSLQPDQTKSESVAIKFTKLQISEFEEAGKSLIKEIQQETEIAFDPQFTKEVCFLLGLFLDDSSDETLFRFKQRIFTHIAWLGDVLIGNVTYNILIGQALLANNSEYIQEQRGNLLSDKHFKSIYNSIYLNLNDSARKNIFNNRADKFKASFFEFMIGLYILFPGNTQKIIEGFKKYIDRKILHSERKV